MRSKHVEPCAECGHAAQQHSNEACEAIRCSCRITRKMLAAKAAAPRKKATEPVVEPVKRPKTRTRRKIDAPAADGAQAPAAADGTQAA